MNLRQRRQLDGRTPSSTAKTTTTARYSTYASTELLRH